jgi:hypothetical protein
VTKRSPWVRKAAKVFDARRRANSGKYKPGDLRVTDDGRGTKVFTIPDLQAFRSRLGKEVTEAFCRCFVHCERLSALGDWIRMLAKHEDPEYVTTSRDLWTVLWFAVGTLKELGIELDKLKGKLRKEGLFDHVPDWGILMVLGFEDLIEGL